jgi:hypothetical protein
MLILFLLKLLNYFTFCVSYEKTDLNSILKMYNDIVETYK